ncbi:MAG: DUF4153 domain-containing protein [Lachnospiraceae bacterium]
MNTLTNDTAGVVQTSGGIPAPKIEKIQPLWAVMFMVCGYLFVWLIHLYEPGVGITIFTGCFILLILLYYRHYYRKNGGEKSSASRGYLLLMALSAANFAIFTNQSLRFFNFLLLLALAIYWVASLGGSRLENKLGSYFISDMLNHTFAIPLRNFPFSFKFIGKGIGQNRRNKNLLAVLLGLFVSIPILAMILPLLTRADASFGTMIHSITGYFWPELSAFLLRLLPAVLIGAYLFGLAYGSFSKSRIDSGSISHIEEGRAKRRKLPAVLIITVLSTISIVYVLFFAAQIMTLADVMQNIRPEGFVYSEFARRGFFELCMVAFINLFIMMCASFFANRAAQTVYKVFTIVLSVETILLIVSAIGKMVLYIQAYGLTQLRVYTSFFMLLLLIVFLLIIVAQFRAFNLTKAIVLTCSLLFLALCYTNPDGMIARYNVNAYQAGTLKEMDTSIFYAAPEASYPAAEDLYATTEDPDLKESLEMFFDTTEYSTYSFQEMNLQRLLYGGKGRPTGS